MDTPQRIREIADSKSLNLKEFAKSIGVEYRTLMRYLSAERDVNTDFLRKVRDRYGTSASWILSGEGPISHSDQPPITTNDENFIQIKRYTVEASAGHGVPISNQAGTGYYAFNQRWLDRRGLKANSLSVISVRGDSMEPDLYENDLLLLDHAQTDLKDSHIYAVQFSDGLYVKRIQHLPEGQIHLISKNKDYPPITVKHPVADGIQIIGRVVASMHEW